MQQDDPNNSSTGPEGEAAENAVTGPEVIARYLKHLGSGPGVYRMMDKAGEVIYVGKARNLKNRVQNYARLTGHTNRIAAMIGSTASMEFVTTATEAEALLLEANLIKRFKPRYNVLMRDDKSFPYILIARDTRQRRRSSSIAARATVKGDYFGPFASAGAVNRTINMLQRAFLLRICSDSVYESRTRPCLLHQIKRCSAPCTGEISLEDYGKLVDEADALPRRARPTLCRRSSTQLMAEASEALEFERAAEYRNRLWALAHVQAAQGINPARRRGGGRVRRPSGRRADLHPGVLLPQRPELGQPRLFPARRQQRRASRRCSSAFIAQFYDDKPVPRSILLSHEVPERELLAEALSHQGRAQGGDPRAAARREARRWSSTR